MTDINQSLKRYNSFADEKIKADLLPGLIYLAEEAQKAGLDDVFEVLNKAVNEIHSVLIANESMH